MKRIWKKRTVLLAALVIFVAALVNPVAAQEPPADLEGKISPSQSWVLRPGEVWELPEGVTDLMIAPVTDSVKVEIEKETVALTGEIAVPEDNPDVRYRRLMPSGGDVYLWSTAGTYEITGWTPVGGIAVVKTGPLGQGGPPPPGNVTPTVVPPEPAPTSAPPEPTPTPVPPTPVPPGPTPEVRERYIVPSFSISEAGHLIMTLGEETTDLGAIRGEPGGPSAADVATILMADESFMGSLPKGEPGSGPTVADITNALKADQTFLDSLQPPEAVIITPRDVITDVAKFLITHNKADLKGEEGPPGPGVSDNFLRLALATFVIALLGLIAAALGWWHRRPDALWAQVNDILDGVHEWAEALGDRATTEALRKFKEEVEENLRAARYDRAQLEQGLQMRPTRESLVPLEKAVGALQSGAVQFEDGLAGLIRRIGELEAEVAPLRPQVAAESNGRLRCPGCNGFVARIAEGLAGHCKRCGVSYTMPVANEVKVAAEGSPTWPEPAD